MLLRGADRGRDGRGLLLLRRRPALRDGVGEDGHHRPAGWGQPPLEGIVEVGIIRCAPMPDDQSNMPSDAVMLAHAELVYADMAASLRAITCDCTGFPKGDLVVNSWSPLSEQGGCSGGAWLVNLGQSYG